MIYEYSLISYDDYEALSFNDYDALTWNPAAPVETPDDPHTLAVSVLRVSTSTALIVTAQIDNFLTTNATSRLITTVEVSAAITNKTISAIQKTAQTEKVNQ